MTIVGQIGERVFLTDFRLSENFIMLIYIDLKAGFLYSVKIKDGVAMISRHPRFQTGQNQWRNAPVRRVRLADGHHLRGAHFSRIYCFFLRKSSDKAGKYLGSKRAPGAPNRL